MKTSWNNIQETESFLKGDMPAGEGFVFQARLLINPVLRANAEAQRRLYQLITYYGRRKMKDRLEQVHNKLMTDPAKDELRREIKILFDGSD